MNIYKIGLKDGIVFTMQASYMAIGEDGTVRLHAGGGGGYDLVAAINDFAFVMLVQAPQLDGESNEIRL